MEQPKNLAIPMKLDAFVFNPSVCDGGPTDAKIAPITQPNYTFLRLEDDLIQNDILDHVDLHNSAPATHNPRLMDLGQAKERNTRVGVYLHWMLPRFYRGGIASTNTADGRSQRQKKGFKDQSLRPLPPDYSAPAFSSVPNRWLVIRKLDPNAPTTLPQGAQIDPVTAWIVESDRMRKIEDATLDGSDLQVDVSPYITSQIPAAAGSGSGISIAGQAEIFIGIRLPAKGWQEQTHDRVDLTVVSSSNHLFPDYQPHCSNVFSMLDTFDCILPDGKTPGTLTAAAASYFVIGWHSDSTEDPFAAIKTTRGDRLQALSMVLNDMKFPPVSSWLKSPDPAQVLCHGSMYNVAWDVTKLPDNVPANQCSALLNNDMPVAVGTTPLDSLLAYLDSHHKTDLEQDLRILGPLLRAQDDGVQAQRAATDEMQNWNFSRTTGGVHFHFQETPDTAPVGPGIVEAGNLDELNRAQRIFDSTTRQISQLRWDTFSLWWKYNSDSDAAGTDYAGEVTTLLDRFNLLAGLATQQKAHVDSLKNDTTKFQVLPKPGVLSEYYQPRDPTLLVAGVQSGWPDDYLDSLKVRLDTQFNRGGGVGAVPVTDMSVYCTDRLPTTLQPTALALVREFLLIGPSLPSPTPAPGEFDPLYHDQGKHGDQADPFVNLRDQWNKTQPWFPLFLEWEAEYFHVPYDDWSLDGRPTWLSDQRWRLGIRKGVTLYNPENPINDTRTVSGRILILPQPNFSLQAQINRLFSTVSPNVLDNILSAAQQQEVKDNTYKLPFLSAPLDGFSDHLLTLVHGTHIKPNVRVPTQPLQPLTDAATGPFTAGAGGPLDVINKNSELTPYGWLVRFVNTDGSAPKPTDPLAFKPATHGQFRFTKLNVIDKFGQAIHAIDPRYASAKNGPDPLYPCISENYEPQLNSDTNQPNLVRPNDPGYCEFVQIPPQINQPTRLNSAFMIHDTTTGPPGNSYWRPATEWENPVWGWIVLNYVDYGVQLFFPDGTFYREVRIASPTDQETPVTSPKYLPFGATTQNTGQLDRLLAKLNDPDPSYLLAFLRMAAQSLQSVASAPSTYSTYLNCLVGRPLALVNAGWSLELASDSKKDQSTLDTVGMTPFGLLAGEGAQRYEFAVKLGDESRACDGLVGYFNAKDGPAPGDELDLDTLYTYYGLDATGGPLKGIDTNSYPKFKAFWLKPDDYATLPVKDAGIQYANEWNSAFTVFGTIVDPFVPITAYSSLLPIQNLQLPQWTWEGAVKKMTAFFHMGPIVVTEDVNTYDPTKKLSLGYVWSPPSLDPTVQDSSVGIPSLPIADWAWLQPYIDPTDQSQQYMALRLGKVDSRPKFERAPYTAIEGYLQLKAPIIRPDT